MRLAVAVLILAISTPGLAVDKTKARELYRLGTQHYNLAEYDKALTAFKEAYRNYEDPIFLFNSGQCERQLGHKEEAVRLYRSYLRNAPDAPNRAEVSDIVARLESTIAVEQGAKRTPAAAAETAPAPVTSTPSAGAAPVANTLESAPQRSNSKRPIHKEWWFWTVIGAVAAGAAVGVAVGVTQSAPSAPTTSTELGNFRF